MHSNATHTVHMFAQQVLIQTVWPCMSPFTIQQDCLFRNVVLNTYLQFFLQKVRSIKIILPQDPNEQLTHYRYWLSDSC